MVSRSRRMSRHDLDERFVLLLPLPLVLEFAFDFCQYENYNCNFDLEPCQFSKGAENLDQVSQQSVSTKTSDRLIRNRDSQSERQKEEWRFFVF
jgi:hypothetical protein